MKIKDIDAIRLLWIKCKILMEVYPVKAHEIAKYFVSLVDEDAGDSISNLKLQKLLYYAQGGFLAMYDQPLFPEAIKAWEHGPVVPQVYHAYKEFGAGPIRVEQVDLSFYTAQIREVLDEVNSVYGQFTAGKLRAMTHSEPPWRDTPLNEVITHEKMKEFFKTLVIVT